MKYRPEVAEFIGTFALVFAGCGAIAVSSTGFGRFFIDPLGIPLAFGLTILVMVYALGHLCGAHFNPAVTLAFAAGGHFPWPRVPTYVAAQVLGATAAAGLLRLAMGPDASLGVTQPAEGFWGAAVVLELVFTFFLMLVILGVATDKRASPGAAGLAIGGTIIVGAIVAGQVSGGSFNPARSLGPAIVAQEFAQLGLYLTAPVAGALLAALTYRFIRGGTLTPLAYDATPLGVLGPVPALRPQPDEESAESAESSA